ncbi:MAG: hypothetical protein ABIA11_03295 [Patescibacteria group bacterium]
MENIYLLKLKRGPTHLPKPTRLGTGAVTTGKVNITDFWKNATEETRNDVFQERTRDYNIEAIGFVIASLDGVTIFSTTQTQNNDAYANPWVIADKNIASRTELKPGKTTADKGEFVLINWNDATHNFRENTIEVYKLTSGVVKSNTVGFLIDNNDERIIIASRHNLEKDTYRDSWGIPKGMIKSIKYLI